MNFSLSVETKVFNQHIRDFNRKTNVTTERVIKKFAFDLLAKIITQMPVLHGRARAGWYAAFEGSGSDGEAIAYPSNAKVDPKEVEIGRSKGKFIDNTKGFGMNKWVELVNGVEYMIFLEYGHSQQAPYGVVRLSIRQMRKAELPQKMSKELQKDWKSFRY